MMTPTRCPVIYVVQVCTGNKKTYFVPNPRIARHPVIFSDDDWGVQSPPQRIVFIGSTIPFSGSVSQDP